MKRRIFFFKFGSNSQKNPFILRELERGFPECRVQTVDVVRDIVLHSARATCGALLESFLRYGREILRHRQNPTMYFPPQPAAQRALHAWVERHVHPEETLFTFANQSLFEASRAGVPHFVYTDHTHLANARYPGQDFTPDERWLARERLIYERARHCFTTSHFARRSLIEDYAIAPERVHCIYSGANATAGLAPPNRTEFHQRILFVGVEWERKGGPELVRAFAQVRRSFPAAELWIVGCAPAVPEARVFGRRPVSELGRFFAEADIFCLPSRKDPSAIALGEAALAGLPIVATDVGGSSDRVLDGESGYLVPPGDEAALVVQLCALLGNPARSLAMGRRGWALAQERFTWSAVGEKLTGHLRAALAAPPSPPKPPILFFKIGGFSHVNANLRKILKREFPASPIREIDVFSDILRPQPSVLARAFLEVLRLYPREIFLRRRKPLDYLLRTPAAFHAVRRWVQAGVRPGAAAFSVQTQSLFDASHPDLPHFVYTDHTCLANRRYPVPVSEELLDPRWLALEKSAYASARITFTTSNFARQSVIEDYGIEPARVVCAYSGLNIRPAAPVPPKPFTQVVLFVGVDWQRKGGPDLLAAFQQVLAGHPGARLRIVGCAPAILHPQIEVLGRISLEAVARQYAEADIFCLPSYHEPSAVALAEAMAHGLPAISTRVGGTPDRVIDGETGLLVEPGDRAALAAALQRLLGDAALCRTLGENGRRRCRELFSWEKTGQRLAEQIQIHLTCP